MLSFRGLLRNRTSVDLPVAVLMLLYTASTSVSAAIINVTANFDAISSNASNTDIKNYLNSVLSGTGYGGTVLSVSGAVPGNDYNGDGHVVGKGVGTSTQSVTSLTLNSEGGNFIMTQGVGGKIVMTFSQPIYGVRFDMQIFPEANNDPDFTFNAFANINDATPIVLGQQTHFFGEVPVGLFSPASGDTPETFKQLLMRDLSFTFPSGATKLEFVDWPVTIGVDNLTFQVNPFAVPEPATMLLFAGVLGGAGVFSRLRRRSPLAE